MTLQKEIDTARKEVIADGYDMSIGELVSLYKDGELVINPAFQRLFRWEHHQKTKFIESILLGIPIPPIFVFQREDGVWELVDGLQRVSTILEFMGLLETPEGQVKQPSMLGGTQYLPALADRTWEGSNSIGKPLQLDVKRARIRVEILKKESDPLTKYELFQRLNTGGSILTPQEVRNCTLVMLDPQFYEWLADLTSYKSFVRTTSQTKKGLLGQSHMELGLRFFVYLHVPYQTGLDVHEYLDKGMFDLVRADPPLKLDEQSKLFKATFDILDGALGSEAFKRYDGHRFLGKFLLSVYEVLAPGAAHAHNELLALASEERKKLIKARAKALWSNPVFTKNSGAGITGTTRLAKLLPLARDYFDQ